MNRARLRGRYISASPAEIDWVLAWLIENPGSWPALSAAWNAYDTRAAGHEPAGEAVP